jgi:hypothetical protein
LFNSVDAFKLRGKPVSIHEQFPAEIENRRKQLYPVMKQAKRDGKMATTTRDKLFIDEINENKMK